MTIGEKIKVLRREQDVTQEKLADYLKISCQAVSKWENGSALPDISLVVPLANFFGVSADVLFGLDAQARSEEIMTFNEEGRRLANLGLVQEQISHWRKAVLKYPKNHHFQIMLAYALLNVCFSEDTGESGQTKEWMAEAVSICARVLSDSTDTDNRSSAAQILVLIYGSESGPMHDEEKAVEYASKAASIFVSRQILLKPPTTGRKRLSSGKQIPCCLLTACAAT